MDTDPLCQKWAQQSKVGTSEFSLTAFIAVAKTYLCIPPLDGHLSVEIL
ncbi:hypothetical protein [Pygmaiobacter massiliensis]|nr:hypothetical protein [Pygmaiobacter massiliensis]MDY4784692.1 hypothetical protein [Pygmaiobacter massiliensis]